MALKRRSQIVWYREIPCTTKRLSREKEKKRCWRQALSFLSDNPRHYTPPSLYMVLYIRRELERCTRLQPYWKKSLFRTTWHKDPFSIALFKSAAASARVFVCLYVCSFAIFLDRHPMAVSWFHPGQRVTFGEAISHLFFLYFFFVRKISWKIIC